MQLLRLATAGSVDDGKSTLIGRLLYDTKSIFEDQYQQLEHRSQQRGETSINLALLTDGLRAEREQGITIDVAYRYFATPNRKFILADTPGHAQYTRNMITGASTANVALILIDARNGIVEQTRRHAIIASLLNIPHIVVCINKMDLVGYQQHVFEQIKEEFCLFSDKLNIQDLQFIPISALAGDNIVQKSENMLWYEGITLLYYLENIYVGSDYNFIDCRFPVQYVIRPETAEYPDYRGYAGTVASGIFKKGDTVTVLPAGFNTKIVKIDTADGEVPEAYPPMAVTLLIEDDIDISRGNMIVRPHNQPHVTQDIEALICWVGDQPMQAAQKYKIMHTTTQTRCLMKTMRYRLDVNTLHRLEATPTLQRNEIARVQLRTTQPLFTDPYQKNKQTGSFILIDEHTHQTVAAGMLVS